MALDGLREVVVPAAPVAHGGRFHAGEARDVRRRDLDSTCHHAFLPTCRGGGAPTHPRLLCAPSYVVVDPIHNISVYSDGVWWPGTGSNADLPVSAGRREQ